MIDAISGRRPNLFLIGAMKSGTTFLRKLLQRHPAVFMCEPDEPSYFVDPSELRTIWPQLWEVGLWRSLENYMALFAEAGAATILGEASTNYAKLPVLTGVPQRLHAFNPDARIIYLLRDPIDRTISHYWHMVRYHSEHRSMLNAFQQDIQFVSVSDYAMQIVPYLDLFGAGQVAVHTHEQLIRDPVGTMQEIYSWLGLDPGPAEILDCERPEHVTPEVVNMALWHGIPRRLSQSPMLRHLRPLLPSSVKNNMRRLTTTSIHRHSVDVTDAVNFLRPIQAEQIKQLERLFNRTFPEWTVSSDGLPLSRAS